MCLQISNYITNRIKERLTKNGKITVWKMFALNDCGEIFNLYFTHIPWEIESNGAISSNRRYTKLLKIETQNKAIYRGIHCLYSKSIGNHNYSINHKPFVDTIQLHLDPLRFNRHSFSHAKWIIVIKATAYEKDFIAAGHHGDVVFRKIYVEKDDIDKAIKEKFDPFI